jgi:acyl-CoA thioester hydrolase
MGVVHHASYVVYLEEARSHYARLRGRSYVDFEATGHYLIVSELHLRYLAPSRYGDLLRVRCWIEELKSRKIVFAYEVFCQERLLLTAQSQHICVDAQGHPKRIPEPWQAWAQ